MDGIILSTEHTFGNNPFRAPAVERPDGQTVESPAVEPFAQEAQNPPVDASAGTDGTLPVEIPAVQEKAEKPRVTAKDRVREALQGIDIPSMKDNDAAAEALFTKLVTDPKYLGWGAIAANERGFFGEKVGSMTGVDKLSRLYDWACGGGDLKSADQQAWDAMEAAGDFERMDAIVQKRLMSSQKQGEDIDAVAKALETYGRSLPEGRMRDIYLAQMMDNAYNRGAKYSNATRIEGKYKSFTPEEISQWNAGVDKAVGDATAAQAAKRRNEYKQRLARENTIYALESIAKDISDGSRAFVARTAMTGDFDRTVFDALPDGEKMQVLALVKERRGEMTKGYKSFDLRDENGEVIDWRRVVYGVGRSITDIPTDVFRTIGDIGDVIGIESSSLFKSITDGEAAKKYRKSAYAELELKHDIHNAMTQEIPEGSSFAGKTVSGFGDNFGFLMIGEVGAVGKIAKARGLAYAARAANIRKAELALETAKATKNAESIAKAEGVLADLSKGRGAGRILKPFEEMGRKVAEAEARGEALTGEIGKQAKEIQAAAREMIERRKLADSLPKANSAYKQAQKELELLRSGKTTGDIEAAAARVRETGIEYGRAARAANPSVQLESAVANSQFLKDIQAAQAQVAKYNKWLQSTGRAAELSGSVTENALWYLPFYTRRLDRAAANGEPMEQAAHSAFVTMLWSGFMEKQAFTKAAKLGIGEVAMTRQSLETVGHLLGKAILGKCTARAKGIALKDAASVFFERQVTNLAHGLDTAFNVTAQSVADEWGVMMSEIWNEAKANLDNGTRTIVDPETGKSVEIPFGREDFVRAFTPDLKWVETCVNVVRQGAYPALGFALLSGTNARFGHWRQSVGEARYLKGIMGDSAYKNYALKNRGLSQLHDDFVKGAQAALDYHLQDLDEQAAQTSMEGSLPDSTQAERDAAKTAKADQLQDAAAKRSETIGKVLELAQGETGAIDAETIADRTGVDAPTAEFLASLAKDYRALMVRDDARQIVNDLAKDLNVRNAEFAMRQFIRFAPNVANVRDEGDGVVSFDVDIGNGRLVNVGMANNEGITNALIEDSIRNPAIANHFRAIERNKADRSRIAYLSGNAESVYVPQRWEDLKDDERRDFAAKVIEGNNRRVGYFFFTGSDGHQHFIPIDDLVTLTGKTTTRAVSHEISHTIFRAAEEIGFISLDDKCALADALGIDRTGEDAVRYTGEKIDGRDKQAWELKVDEAIADGYAEYTNGKSAPSLPRVRTAYDSINKVGNTIIDTFFGGAQARQAEETMVDDLYEAMFRGDLESIHDIAEPLRTGELSLRTRRAQAQADLAAAREAFADADDAHKESARQVLKDAQKALHKVNAEWDAEHRRSRVDAMNRQASGSNFSLVGGAEKARLEEEFKGEDGTEYLLSYLSKGDPKWGNDEWNEYIDAIDWSRCGDYVRTYRAMEMTEDGGLIPPMASFIGTGAKDRKINGLAHVGDIVKSDENPELRIKGGKDDGKFPLWKQALKRDKKTGRYKVDWSKVAAAYNPYIHSSFRPLNDQFQLAWARPNLYTVEMLIPTSEFKKDSRYWAEFAKNSIGLHPWTSGSVTRQLTAFNRPARQVLMTQYGKINRVLSNEEVAQKIMEDFGDAADKISIPQEVFPPEVYKLLTEKHGVKGVAMEDAEAKMQAVDELMSGNGSRNSLVTPEMFDAIENEFTTTDDPRDAGWILPNGKMLDFQRSKYNFDDVDNPYGNEYENVLDHSDIKYGIPEEMMTDDLDDESGAIYGAERGGAIRLDVIHNIMELSSKPNVEQYDSIRKAFDSAKGAIVVDFIDWNTRNRESQEYNSADQLIADANRFFSGDSIVRSEDADRVAMFHGDDFGNYSLILGEKGARRLSNNVSILDNFLSAKNMLFEKSAYVDGEQADAWKKISRDDQLKIKLATGWEIGADGQWKLEVKNPNLKANWIDAIKQGCTLEDVFDPMSELFMMYPDARNIKVESYPIRNAYAQLVGNRIDIDTQTVNADVSGTIESLLHEVQHWVQDHSGFGKGGNEQMFRQKQISDPKMKKIANEYKKSVRRHFVVGSTGERMVWDILDSLVNGSYKSNWHESLYTPVIDSLRDLANKNGYTSSVHLAKAIVDARERESPYGQYHRLAGEVESRNAERRTYADMVSKLLEDTEDESRDIQIVRRDVSGTMDKVDNDYSRMSLAEGEEISIYIPDGRYEDGTYADFIGAILDGWKRGETRSHRNLPKHKWIGIEKNGMVYGRVMLGDPVEITNKSAEYGHAAIDGTEYGLADGETKFYYPIEDKQDFRDDPIPLNRNGNYGVYRLPENVYSPERGQSVSTDGGVGNYSLVSIAQAAGFEGRTDEDGRWIGFFADGKQKKSVSRDDILASPIGRFLDFSLERGEIDKDTHHGVADLFSAICTTIAKTGDEGFGQQVFGSAIFTGIKTNSDKQYGTTYDFPSICTKTQAMIDAMSENMVRLGRGLSKDEMLALYQHIFDLGAAVPCPECYVFSRWIGIGGMLDNLRKYQDRFGAMKVENVLAKYRELEAQIEQVVKDWNADPEHADKQISFGKGKGKLATKYTKEYNKLLDQVETTRNKGEEVSPADELKLQFLETQMDTVKAMTWIEDVYFADKAMTKRRENFRVPDEVLFDLNNAEAFATKYPQAWYWRCTQGAGYGKAITPYAESVLGEGIQSIGGQISNVIKTKKAGTFKNQFLGETLDKKARATMEKAVRNMKVQAFLGGQRFQSTSDARFENMTDYLLAHLEVQTMHGMVQLYTKVLSAVPFFAKTGDSVNMSMMPDTRYGGLKDDGNGNLVPVDTATGGANPERAQELRKELPTAGTITIGVNDQHIRALVRQAWRDFVIPYHVSGGDARLVSSMRLIQEADAKVSKKFGVPQEAKLSTDYTTTQGDKVLTDIQLQEYWHLTPEQIDRVHKMREQRLAILTRGGSGKNKIALDMDFIRSNKFLSRLYDRLNGGEWDGVTVGKGKVDGHIFPNEFFDTTVKSVEESKIWTVEYLEYCRDLGYLHRFSGMKSASGKLIVSKGRDRFGEKVDMEDLFYLDGKCRHGEVDPDAVEPLMWKVLVDRRMLDNNNHYQAQKYINLNGSSIGDLTSFAQNQQGVRNYDTFVAKNDHAKVEDLVAAKSQDGRMANAAKGNFSLAIPPDVAGSMSTEDLLAMAAAGRLAKSVGGDSRIATEAGVRKDVANRLRELNPNATEADVDRLMSRAKTDAVSVMQGIENTASKDILGRLTEKQAARYYASLRSAGRKGLGEGAKATRAAVRFDQIVAQKQADAIAAETGLAANELEATLGVDLAETMLNLQDIFDEAKKARGDDPAVDDETDGDGEAEPDFTPDGLTPEEKAQKEKAIRDLCRGIMEKAWQADEEWKKKQAERKAKREADKAKRAEDPDAPAEYGDAEGEELPTTAEDIAQFIASKVAIDLRNPHQFAQFVKIMCEEKWKTDHGLAKDAYIWGEPLALQHLRMTASNVYGDLARKLMYSNKRETALRQINKIEHAPTVGSLINEMEFCGRVIAQGMVTEKRKDLVKDVDQLLKQAFGATGRFRQNEEDINRKVSGFTELWAREVRKWIWASENKVADELQKTLEELAGVEAEFRVNGRDPNSSKNFNHNLLKMEVLQQFGALVHKSLGEITDARVRILDRLENDTVGAQMMEREERTRRIADLIERAVNANRRYAYDDEHAGKIAKGVRKASNYFQEHLDFKHLLLDLGRFCKDAGDRAAYEAFVDDLQHKIQLNWDRSKTEQRKELVAFKKQVEAIYGKSYAKAMSELIAHDERFDKFGSMIERTVVENQDVSPVEEMIAKKEGKPNPRRQERERIVSVKMSKAQAMQLYVSMQQKGYIDNVVKNRREAQSAELRKLFTAQDLQMLNWLGEWYDKNRQAISDVSQRIFGLPVEAEEANYFPVTPYRPSQGLNEMTSEAWSPFPPALTARVRHGYDFDVRKGIFDVWAERMQEQAQWKNFAELGIELRGIFGRQSVQSMIKDQHGEKAFANVKAFINDILNGGASVKGKLEFWDTVRGWTALAALGGNIGVMLKQTTSIPAFAFEIGFPDMGKHFASSLWAITGGAVGNAVGIRSEALAAMREIFDSEQRKNRWDDGNSDEVTNALRLIDEKPELFKSIMKKAMCFNKFGDIVPALFVGQGIYRSFLGKGLSKEEAMNRTWEIINRTQQTGQMDNLTAFQRRSALGRFVTQFQTTVRQYTAYEIAAIRNFAAQPNGRNLKDLASATALNGILASLYFWGGAMWQWILGRKPDEDTVKGWMESMLTSCWGSLFMLGSFASICSETLVTGGTRTTATAPSMALAGTMFTDMAKIVGMGLKDLAAAVGWGDADYTLDDFLKAADHGMKAFNSPYRDASKVYHWRVKGEKPNGVKSGRRQETKRKLLKRRDR